MISSSTNAFTATWRHWAKACHDAGVDREKVYTHIVALSTDNPANTFMPPIWTAVNPYSTPGFTMDNKGGAKYDMARLKEELVAAPGSRGAVFANVETYFGLGSNKYVIDAESYKEEIDTLFGDGATAMVVYGTFPFGSKTPAAGIAAIKTWLKEAQSPYGDALRGRE